MKTLLVICWITACLALSMLFGCNKASENAEESASEEISETASAVEADAGVGQEEAQIETPAGGEMEVALGEMDLDVGGGELTAVNEAVPATPTPEFPPAMPHSWPKAFPKYPDSTITASSSSTDSGGLKMGVTLTTSDPVGRVVRFYTEKAESGGYKTNSSRDVGKIRIRHYVSKEFIVDVNIVQNSRTVTVTMTTRTNEDD